MSRPIDPVGEAKAATDEKVTGLEAELRAARSQLVRLEHDIRRARIQSKTRGDTIRLLESRLEAAEQRVMFLDDLAEAPDPEPVKLTARKRSGKLPQAAYVMLASDWHLEENVRPETCQGRNEYNPDISQERARQFFESNLTLLDTARASWNIDQIVFWLGGDLITGYIHEEYLEENWLSPTEASLLAYEVIVAGIDRLLAVSDVRHILIPTSHGNHGRTQPYKKIATSAKNSYEWLLYQHLARHYAKEKRVTFQIASGYHNVIELFGIRIRFHHGDEVRYLGGVGGLSVPAQRRIMRQAKGDPDPIHLDVIGHHHHLQYPPDLIVNGSLIGWNAYADTKGFGYQEPLQGSFVVDAKYKLVSAFNPVIVSKRHAR